MFHDLLIKQFVSNVIYHFHFLINWAGLASTVSTLPSSRLGGIGLDPRPTHSCLLGTARTSRPGVSIMYLRVVSCQVSET